MRLPNIFTLSFLIILSGEAIAQAPAGYYQNAATLSGYQLKHKLHQIVSKGTTSWNYGDLPSFYEQTDRDLYYENDSSLLDIYSENPAGTDPYVYWYNNNSLIAGASNEGEGWNREHIYSQSFFNSNYPMYSDLHFVVPTDARVNQQRSNFPFGKVGNSPTFTSLNGTKRGPANIPGYTNTVTEPIDEFKGDIARMLMFVAVRYENLLPYFQYTNVRNPLDSLSEKAFKNWYISMLLQWHQNDPVSQKEIDRNNAVFNLQGNRNPFVDYPAFATSIWGNLSNSTDVPEQPYQLSVETKGARFIHVSWPYVQDPDVLGFEVFLNDTRVGTTADNEFIFHHLTANTNYDIKVRSYSNAYVNSAFAVLNAVSTLDVDTFSSDLFISKFIVGSANNKVVELYNNTGYTVDLRDYYFNIRQENSSTGSLYWSSNKVQLEGQLPHGKKLVVMNPNAQLACFATDSADILSNGTPMRFDGKYAFELSYNSTSLDRLGSSSSTADYAVGRSLYRKPNFNYPSSSYDTAQWIFHPLNYCEDLGNPVDSSVSVRNINPTRSKQFELYPNPNKNGLIYVEGKGLKSVKNVRIISIDGRELSSIENPFKNTNTILLPKQAQGLVLILIDGAAYTIVVE